MVFQIFGVWKISQAGRVCGKCKKMVEDVIKDSQHLIDPNMPKKVLKILKEKKRSLWLKNV